MKKVMGLKKSGCKIFSLRFLKVSGIALMGSLQVSTEVLLVKLCMQ